MCVSGTGGRDRREVAICRLTVSRRTVAKAQGGLVCGRGGEKWERNGQKIGDVMISSVATGVRGGVAGQDGEDLER